MGKCMRNFITLLKMSRLVVMFSWLTSQQLTKTPCRSVIMSGMIWWNKSEDREAVFKLFRVVHEYRIHYTWLPFRIEGSSELFWLHFCQSSVCLAKNFSHFQLFSGTCVANLNQTWHRVLFGEGESYIFQMKCLIFSERRLKYIDDYLKL